MLNKDFRQIKKQNSIIFGKIYIVIVFLKNRMQLFFPRSEYEVMDKSTSTLLPIIMNVL